MQLNNLVSDLEKALAARSADAGTMLQQITELFLQHAGHYSEEQLRVYDEVLNELVGKVETAARVKLAQRLAPVHGAPAKTLCLLALDNAIEVAEPILSQSCSLTDITLTRCIATKGQKYLHAIATRKCISEPITSQLILKGDRIVLGTLACNAGAAISDHGFGLLVRKVADDDWLLECIAGRRDIPSHHLRDLLSKASEIVRKKLTTEYPALRAIIENIFPSRTSTTQPRTAHIDYRAILAAVSSRGLTEAAVNEFAKNKRLAETIVSISRLSGLSVSEIERLFLGRWTSPVAIILKAIGFQLQTVDAIYRSRLTDEAIGSDLIQTKAEFIAIRQHTAERIVTPLLCQASGHAFQHQSQFGSTSSRNLEAESGKSRLGVAGLAGHRDDNGCRKQIRCGRDLPLFCKGRVYPSDRHHRRLTKVNALQCLQVMHR